MRQKKWFQDYLLLLKGPSSYSNTSSNSHFYFEADALGM